MIHQIYIDETGTPTQWAEGGGQSGEGWLTVEPDDPRYLALRNPPPALDDLLDRLKQLRESKAGLMRWQHGGQDVVVQTDRDSRINILGAKALADMAIAASQPFSENWTLADNAKLALDADGMIALAVAAGQHVAACHDHYDSLRTALIDAATIEDARAIDLTTGWPASCA